MADKDYSATPVWRKLGIAEGARVHVLGAPADFDMASDPAAPLPPGVHTLARPARDLDVTVAFVTRASSLHRRFPALVRSMARHGRLWIAWPKKTSDIPTDLDFGTVQRTGLGAGLVDNKSASLTDSFQGLQFVYRREDR